jgi:hypothetical protein
LVKLTMDDLLERDYLPVAGSVPQGDPDAAAVAHWID